MSDANRRRHEINKLLAQLWRAEIEYWLLHEEYELKSETLEPIAIQCAIDAMHSTMYHIMKLRQRLRDLDVDDDDMRRPPFFPFG